MGEMSDMMLEGTLCQHCGACDDEEGYAHHIEDVPWCCPDCRKDCGCLTFGDLREEQP